MLHPGRILPSTNTVVFLTSAGVSSRLFDRFIRSTRKTGIPSSHLLILVLNLDSPRPFYQQQTHTGQWHLLLKIVTAKNQRLFWNIITACSTQSSPHLIPASTWESQFRKLFWGDCVQELHQVNSEIKELPIWSSVSTAKVLTLIDQLKSGEAAGPEYIPSDMLKFTPQRCPFPFPNGSVYKCGQFWANTQILNTILLLFQSTKKGESK